MSDVTNLRDTIIPKSDQLNAEQLITKPMTITVTNVKRGDVDQPVIINYTNDEGRPFKPCKTMRKILIFAWGDDGRNWVGKSMTLYCDHEVKFGGVKVGGIRISHMTGIERDMAVSLNTTKGKKGEFIIKKLSEIREKDAIEKMLAEAAKGGMRDLQHVWAKTLSAPERDIFGGTCPEMYKNQASDVDSGVPKNISGNQP